MKGAKRSGTDLRPITAIPTPYLWWVRGRALRAQPFRGPRITTSSHQSFVRTRDLPKRFSLEEGAPARSNFRTQGIGDVSGFNRGLRGKRKIREMVMDAASIWGRTLWQCLSQSSSGRPALGLRDARPSHRIWSSTSQ